MSTDGYYSDLCLVDIWLTWVRFPIEYDWLTNSVKYVHLLSMIYQVLSHALRQVDTYSGYPGYLLCQLVTYLPWILTMNVWYLGSIISIIV